MLPLLEVKMELQAPEMVFNPSLEQDAASGFYSLVEELLEDIFKFASLVPRVAKHKEMDNYLPEVEELVELLDLREEIMQRVSNAIDKALEHRSSFDNYAYLWVDDRQEFMHQFLCYGHVLTAEEIEQAGEEGVPKTPPTLTQFKEQVDSYEMIYSDVVKFQVRPVKRHTEFICWCMVVTCDYLGVICTVCTPFYTCVCTRTPCSIHVSPLGLPRTQC